MKCASNPIPGLSLLFLHHGNGSGVRHVHIKYHGHLLYYQAAVLTIVIYCLIFAMVTVVVGVFEVSWA